MPDWIIENNVRLLKTIAGFRRRMPDYCRQRPDYRNNGRLTDPEIATRGLSLGKLGHRRQCGFGMIWSNDYWRIGKDRYANVHGNSTREFPHKAVLAVGMLSRQRLSSMEC